jgi:hypothetical protein
MPLDVSRSAELQAALLALRAADRDIRSDINKDARNELNPEWQQQLQAKVSTKLERAALLPGARLSFGTRGGGALASTRKLSGGLVPKRDYGPVEFGSSRSKQFRAFNRYGYVAHQAAPKVIRRAVAIWVTTIVQKFAQVATIKDR